jgi:hypothetical protein
MFGRRIRSVRGHLSPRNSDQSAPPPQMRNQGIQHPAKRPKTPCNFWRRVGVVWRWRNDRGREACSRGPLFHGDLIVGSEVGEFAAVGGPHAPGRFGRDIDDSFLAAGLPHDVEYEVVSRRTANAALRCSIGVVLPEKKCSLMAYSPSAVPASSESCGVASQFKLQAFAIVERQDQESERIRGSRRCARPSRS